MPTFRKRGKNRDTHIIKALFLEVRLLTIKKRNFTVGQLQKRQEKSKGRRHNWVRFFFFAFLFFHSFRWWWTDFIFNKNLIIIIIVKLVLLLLLFQLFKECYTIRRDSFIEKFFFSWLAWAWVQNPFSTRISFSLLLLLLLYFVSQYPNNRNYSMYYY